ncbi:MAG: hypothetical protein OXC17_15200 [Aestuariivita sp.]|nr:hypothetical protein [Aestuariivita sp.]
MSAGYDVGFSNPLELMLKESVEKENSENDFPACKLNRWDFYKQTKAKLNEDFYQDIDGALTAGDSEHPAFTRHGLSHVNDVIRRVGQLLGLGSQASSPAAHNLSSYESFVLLVACLIHDAGNKFGRDGHATKAKRILRQIANGVLNEKELSIISKVAQAHGGKAADGSKDTIGALPEKDGVESCEVRLQLLAALLRYGDELAENQGRANTRGVAESDFPNLFCKCISVNVDYENRRVSLDFAINNGESNQYGSNEQGENMYFVDYIWNRVVKAELERRYCDQFLRGFSTYRETRVTADFCHDDREWREQIAFTLTDSGYPDDRDLRSKPKLDGKKIADLYDDYTSRERQS